ncbi:MAG: 2Fe-2S iron-sulfur cluster binding domain-containing protein [Magnetococcales bacterium]|nr:2Fe-2S iron-sulfur cluster binding domain-containing protein [Magnetococcales bacterium]
MNSLELFSYIVMGLLAQLTIFAGMAFYRHWLTYQALQRRLAGFEADLPNSPVQNDKPNGKLIDSQTDGWEGFREFRVQRKVFEDVSRSICSLYLVPTDGYSLPAFKPGQFLTFQFNISDSVTGKSKTIMRCYSLSERPGLGYYRVSIKKVPPPIHSKGVPPGLASNHVHASVHEDTRLLIKAPSGHFFLEQGEAPIVLIAGGIGITPLLSMLNANFEGGQSREIWLFYGVRNSAEHVRKEYLETLASKQTKFHLHVCYSQPLPEDMHGKDFQHAGHVDITLLRLTLSLKPYRFYVCGPGAMMNSLVPDLDTWGVPEEHIHFEAFGPASIAKPNNHQTSLSEMASFSATRSVVTVTFSKSEKTLPWDENVNSLLEFAELNGIEVESGCRAGGCGTCQTTIRDGEVIYSQTPNFDPEPGSCLLCISKPKRDLLLVA